MPACVVNTPLLTISYSTRDLSLILGHLIVGCGSYFDDDRIPFTQSIKKKYNLEL